MNGVGIRVTFDFGKIILTKNSEFVEIFVNKGFFVLHNVIKDNINAPLAYITKSISLWHARLGSVNITSIKRLYV